MAETVRIDPKIHAKLAALARAKHLPLTEVLARAVEAYDRAELLARFNADYAAMRSDPAAWQAELDERAAWDSSLLDGLDDEQKTTRKEPRRAKRKAAKARRPTNRSKSPR